MSVLLWAACGILGLVGITFMTASLGILAIIDIHYGSLESYLVWFVIGAVQAELSLRLCSVKENGEVNRKIKGNNCIVRNISYL